MYEGQGKQLQFSLIFCKTNKTKTHPVSMKSKKTQSILILKLLKDNYGFEISLF